MRIGVVCEGPTDFYAITHFIGGWLDVQGVNSTMVAIQPDMDNSRPEGGWANVFTWLNKNNAQSRVIRFFGAGLFRGALGSEPLDAIIIQVDTDILDDKGFSNYINETYGYTVNRPVDPVGRRVEMQRVIELACDFASITEVDVNRHIIAPAVENTETWCIASFYPAENQCESISPIGVITPFMVALERSEGRQPKAGYINVDKDCDRREAFCRAFRSQAGRVYEKCAAFSQACDRVLALK